MATIRLNDRIFAFDKEIRKLQPNKQECIEYHSVALVKFDALGLFAWPKPTPHKGCNGLFTLRGNGTGTGTENGTESNGF